MNRQTPTLDAAWRRVADLYDTVPESAWPDVNGPEWKRREASIDAAYVANDSKAFKQAVAEWESFAVGALRGAA